MIGVHPPQNKGRTTVRSTRQPWQLEFLHIPATILSQGYEGQKKGDYMHHQLPTGARPVPKNAEGHREIGGWEFHYGKLVNNSPTKFRTAATRTNPFPDSRKGSLDYKLLKKNGLNKGASCAEGCLVFLAATIPNL